MITALMLSALKLPTVWLAAAATDYGANCKLPANTFFFLPPWWEYLPTKIDNVTGECVVVFNFPNDILTVGLAVLDMLLRLGGFLAVISIIIAGVQYITSSGNADSATNARKRLINSIIGLAIVLVAAGVVQFVGNEIGG